MQQIMQRQSQDGSRGDTWRFIFSSLSFILCPSSCNLCSWAKNLSSSSVRLVSQSSNLTCRNCCSSASRRARCSRTSVRFSWSFRSASLRSCLVSSNCLSNSSRAANCFWASVPSSSSLCHCSNISGWILCGSFKIHSSEGSSSKCTMVKSVCCNVLITRKRDAGGSNTSPSSKGEYAEMSRACRCVNSIVKIVRSPVSPKNISFVNVPKTVVVLVKPCQVNSLPTG
mmetsp:Transcript_98143/g.184564  ORF Transcript_98143/g.184564 Transcript_98143/m.184564 type:complete len:227 (-) Transcript_98143:544-1224(-)